MKIIAAFSAAIIMILIFSGCGRLINEKALNNIPAANSVSTSSNTKTQENLNSGIKPSIRNTDVQMQNLSGVMDKMGTAMNDLDDSKDITDLESIINNN